MSKILDTADLLTRCDADFFGNDTLVTVLLFWLFSLFWNFMYFLCESIIEFRSLRIASLLSRMSVGVVFQQSVLALRKLTGGRFVKLDISNKGRKLYYFCSSSFCVCFFAFLLSMIYYYFYF